MRSELRRSARMLMGIRPPGMVRIFNHRQRPRRQIRRGITHGHDLEQIENLFDGF